MSQTVSKAMLSAKNQTASVGMSCNDSYPTARFLLHSPTSAPWRVRSCLPLPSSYASDMLVCVSPGDLVFCTHGSKGLKCPRSVCGSRLSLQCGLLDHTFFFPWLVS